MNSEMLNQPRQDENINSVEHIENNSTTTPATMFREKLKHVISSQENILQMTSMAKEKIKYANEITFDQIKTFKENANQYGKYLKLIHDELQMISETIKKIKKDSKEIK